MILEFIKQLVDITHPFTLTIFGVGFYISYKYLIKSEMEKNE